MTRRTPSEILILRIACPDKPGLIAGVAGCLRDLDCNIEESSQFSDKVAGRFFMRTVFSPWSGTFDREKFDAVFTPFAQACGMNWFLNRASEKVRALILVSKADHCLNDLFYRTRTGHLPLDITAVVSNHETCRDFVEQRGARFAFLPVRSETKPEQEAALHALVEETGTELIILARYMQVLSDEFCQHYPGRIINIHHSFLPGFKGARPYHQAYERGVKLIGATAHFVTPELDEGPIIEQETSRIDHALTPEKLQILGQDTEALVLSRAVLAYCERRVFLHGNRTVLLS